MINQIEKNWDLVFRDDFTPYEVGDFSEGYSAVSEVHFPEKKIFQGEWQEISSHHLWVASRNPNFPNWKIKMEGQEKRLEQTLFNALNRKNWKYPIKKLFFKSRLQLILAMPALAAGDPLWADYCLRVQVNPLSKEDYAGLIFRLVDGQSHYLFGLRGDKAALLKRMGNELVPIASANYPYSSNRYYILSVLAEGESLKCFIDNQLIFNEVDQTFPAGKVGLVSNVPALFKKVETYMPPVSRKSLRSEKEKLSVAESELQEKYPKMALWKKIKLAGPCSGRSIRFGDLTGNGQLDMVLAQGTELAQDHYMINCLTAMDQEGNVLWQKGQDSGDRKCLAADLAFQIYDIDGDGFNEVVCAMNYQILILDGRTGKVKNKQPTPKSTGPQNSFPQIIGDCFYFANLSGGDRPREILFKDRYSKLFAYSNQLELLWEHEGNTGHFPFTVDMDNNGRERILIGYTLLDEKGKKIWELPLQDHADVVSIVKFPGDTHYTVIIAASDEGLVFADMQGKIRKHLRLGHAQTVTIANLMGDSSQVQIATNTFWGNPGIISILNKEGDILRSFQPSVYGSPLFPVSWSGEDQKLLLLSARHTREGGLYDGFGRQAVSFPDDGHPYLCYDALDFTGDFREEIVCWDMNELWIYTQSGAPAVPSSTRMAIQPPLFNASNYRSNLIF